VDIAIRRPENDSARTPSPWVATTGTHSAGNRGTKRRGRSGEGAGGTGNPFRANVPIDDNRSDRCLGKTPRWGEELLKAPPSLAYFLFGEFRAFPDEWARTTTFSLQANHYLGVIWLSRANRTPKTLWEIPFCLPFPLLWSYCNARGRSNRTAKDLSPSFLFLLGHIFDTLYQIFHSVNKGPKLIVLGKGRKCFD